MPVALITGASKGLGRELARALAARAWHLVITARNGRELDTVATELPDVSAVRGDVTSARHRHRLIAEAVRHGGIDLLVNNASRLGPSPQPALDRYPLDELRRVYETDVIAPLALTQLALPLLRTSRGAVVNITSDAAVERYDGWGGYGSAKAALDQWTNILGSEQPPLRVYAFDPGDMRTAMHQAAFPDEDISDRPEPATVIPAFLRLLDERLPSGRYRAADLLAPAAVAR